MLTHQGSEEMVVNIFDSLRTISMLIRVAESLGLNFGSSNLCPCWIPFHVLVLIRDICWGSTIGFLLQYCISRLSTRYVTGLDEETSLVTWHQRKITRLVLVKIISVSPFPLAELVEKFIWLFSFPSPKHFPVQEKYRRFTLFDAAGLPLDLSRSG